MATLEKLVRTVEALKLHQTPSVALDETMTKKDKIAHCVSVTDILCSQGLKNSPESAKYLAMAMEMFFTLIDDQDADVRMVSDENLNRVTRSLGDSSVGRLQVELYKEIKKNGSSRCVRAALSRFSALAQHIRPAKCRPYLVNLLPCLAALARRSEEPVHEALAQSLPGLFQVLGPHTNDNEVKILLKSFLANIGSASAVIRRTTATVLTVLVTHCRKPTLFSSWLLTTCSNLLLPLNTNTPSNLIIGVLTVCRQILPSFTQLNDESEALLQLYELAITFTDHKDHNIVNASLETIQQLLRSAPSLLIYFLSAPGGAGKSRLSVDQYEGETSSTPPPEFPHSSLPTDPSLHSISDITEVMANSILSFPDTNINDSEANDADSEGDEPREEIIIPPPDPKPPVEKVANNNNCNLESGVIGHFEDEGISLHFLTRKLVSMFLLSQEKGETVSDSKARVSVKTLGMSCLSEVILLCPQVWTLPLFLDRQENLTSVVVSDLVLYLDHEDPGLRGSAARLVFRVLRGACLESGGKLDRWFAEREQDQAELLTLVTDLLSDQSSVTLRQVISGARLAVPLLVQSSERAGTAKLLDRLPTLATNKYWLVKVELCDLLAGIDCLAASYILPSWPRVVTSALCFLLGEEDARVRGAAAAGLVKVASAIPVENTASLSVLASEKLAGLHFNYVDTFEGDISNLSTEVCKPVLKKVSSFFHLLSRITEMLKTATSRHLMFGCIEFLSLLAADHSPRLHPSDWGVHLPRSRRPLSQAPTPLSCPSLTIMSSTVKLLSSSLPCQDLTIHTSLLNLVGQLYSGQVAHNLRESSEMSREGVTALVANDGVLADLGEALLLHLIKLLSILHHVFEDTSPSLPSSKPTLPSLPNATLSPIKKRNTEPSTPISPPPTEKTFNPKDEKKLKGTFVGNPFYMKQYEILKSSHNVFKSTLETKSEEKLVQFTGSILECFSLLLEYSIGTDIGKYVEECLGYIKSCLGISASKTLRAVQCLLKCLFKSNYPFSSYTHSHDVLLSPMSQSIFDHIISSPYTKMTVDHGLVVEGREMSTSIPRINRGASRPHPFRASARNADRSSLANYIRLFEPMVIKALKHYTVTSDVDRQSQVLQLLIQLVRLRVNYCLLDSDQIFIGFVLKQLEAIEEGQLNNAEFLIPHIFEFLVLLSYEKYHSKVIIDVPKILQLCEGLAARGESSHSYVVPALQIVSMDLFAGRNSTTEGELEAQREVVISMLLKQLSQQKVMETLSQVLTWIGNETGGEDKARKLSRQIVDTLIPLLCSHQIEMKSRSHLQTLKKLLKTLSPGSLRPCDPILSSLMSCACDLGVLSEVLSWLSFTITSFVTIFQLSPEEAILGRLQELGIMLGSAGSSILDTSMECSISSDPLRQPATAPPEFTLSTFILHVIGSATSKLHQMVFSPSPQDAEGQLFLQQELADLLLIMTYILQSGRCVRIAKSMVYIAKNGQSGALHNVDLITDLVLQLAHSAPVLVVQWMYVLVLLERCSPTVWAKVLGIGRGPANSRFNGMEQSEPASSLYLEVSRKAALAVLANHLVENTNDGELLAWFLSSQIKEIILNVEEPQIKEFITVVHRQSPASGLFLEAISARLEMMKSADFFTCILDCLSNIHVAHTGRVIQLLISKFLINPVLALAQKASNLASRRVEHLLSETETFVHEQLNQSDVASLLETLSRKVIAKRNSKLVALLNRLAVSFYDLSPLEQSDGRKFNPGSVSGVVLDRTWYLQQVKRSCCSSSPPQECAKLLANLSFSDIMQVMTAKDFNVRILEECLLQGITLPDGRAPSIDSLDRLPGLLSDPERSPGLRDAGVHLKEGPPLYRAASQVLLQHIKNVVELLPRPVQVYRPHKWWNITHAETKYTHRMDDMFARSEGRSLITQLLPGFARLLTTYPRLPGRRPALPPHAVLEMARFGVLALEMVKWFVAGCREQVAGMHSTISLCLQIAGLTFSNPHLAAALALPANSVWAASAVISIVDHLLANTQLSLPSFPYEEINEALQAVNPPPILVAGTCLARIIMLLEQLKPTEIPFALEQAIPALICLARLPQFSFLARAPPLAFSLGWQPKLELEGQLMVGNVPEDLLQEVDVLRQLVWRLNALGWTSRAQFEETWMCLLSVLNVSRDDLTNEEVSALSQSTALVVAAITSLLVNTLALPVAGIPGARLLHHPRDSPHPCLMSGRGQQLTAIQNIIHQRLEDRGASPGLPVDSSVNLERATCQASITWAGYSPVPVAGYGAAQVSVNYLHTCMAYHEEGSDDRQSITSAALPLFLLLREENLAAAGLDTHSCTHFLTDLFSQWLAHGGQDTPLTVLTASVRAMIMISDIFTQDSQFNWMLGALSDLYKVHPVEDELLSGLLLLGISKAVAVIGFRESDLYERLKKGLENSLKSAHLPARAAAVHSLLYLLQRETNQETVGFFILASDHLKANMLGGRGSTDVDQHSMVLWSMLFFTIENCENDMMEPELKDNLVQICIGTAGQADLPMLVYTTILTGLERLVVAGLVRGRQLEQVVKLATDLMTDWPPSSVLPAIQLFLAAMYSSHPPSSDPSQRPTPITDPEMLMQMMEQMSILFDCVRRAGPTQAELLAEILPQVLIDFFPASDVVNRVISEFISPGQPHPALLAGVLKQIFRAAVSQDQQNMLTEWVLVSLPNFTRRAPLSHSIWCLSCFFLAASPNPWLQAMFPHLQHRQPTDSTTPHEDKRLFCLAAADFYACLTDERQKAKFIQTFEAVAAPGSPYAELLSTIEHRTEGGLLAI